MDNDEDLFVLIIGDEHCQGPEQELIEVKDEILVIEDKTESDKYLQKKTMGHQEILKLWNNNIESSEHEVKVDLKQIKSEDNEKYNFSYDIEAELSEDNKMSSDEEKYTIRRRKLTGYECISYVADLKEQYPELIDNNELLIDSLVEIMKALKPPPLPLDYFIMNGIMFKCVKCGVESGSIPAAGRHYLERHGPRYLICYACGADFRCKTNLYKHERVCGAPDIEVTLKARALFFGRSKCYKSLAPKQKRVHKKYTPGSYKCTLCSAVFATRRGLRTHKYFHSGERPYLCPTCPSAYTSQTTLNRHITHKHGNHYYICDVCQRRFKIKSALAMHMNTHEPLKKFACSECDKRYAVKSSLQLHVSRDHRGNPLPFACNMCEKRFPWTTSLRDHMKKEHGMKLYTRQGFFKKLPTLSSDQLQQAQVILKKNMEDKTKIK